MKWTFQRLCYFFKLSSVVFVLVLAGCVSVTPPSTTGQIYQKQSPAKRQARLRNIMAWQIAGAFSVTLNQKTDMANYQWQQKNRNTYHIRIASALNLYTYTLVGKKGSATLWQSATKHVTAKTPEGVMQKIMGWSLPVSDLYYWMRSVPAPVAVQAVNYDQFGHLISMRQKGWRITYNNFANIHGNDLPQLIQLQRPGMSIRIVVKQWATYPHTLK